MDQLEDGTEWPGPALPGPAWPAGLNQRGPRKTLLVDDHAMVRESLLLLLDQRLPGHLWRGASTLAAALALLHNEPDIGLVLLDLDVGDSRGLATLSAVREAAPQVPVVVLSAQDDRAHVLAAVERGAAGFLSKAVDAQALVLGVRRVLAGGVILPAAINAARADRPAPPELSDRQRDVLRLLIQGQSNKLMGRSLGLTEATVKTHLQMVYRKLGVETRTQAVLAAARWRLRL